VPVEHSFNDRVDDRGFTLIEVLVALVIVSLGMLGVIQTVSQTASNSTYMRDKTIAHWIAMNQLTETRLLPAAPKVDKSSDEVEMAGRKWRWTMEVQQTPVETMRRIDVKVRLEDAPANSSMASVTGFYGSAVAPPGTTLINWQGSQAPGGGPRDPNEPGSPPPRQEPEPEPEPGEPELGDPVESPPLEDET
jgi:general secretion pathway protein I